jgi:MFS family permease
MDEKLPSQSIHVDDERRRTSTVVKEANVRSAVLAAAHEASKPRLLSKNMVKLYMIMAVGYLVSTLNGFDSSLMGAINAMKPYQDTFNLTGAGSSTGIIFIIYNCGQIAAFPFCGFFADGYGRRVCIFVGCVLVLVGTAIQATANHMGQFIGGRFVLGFGGKFNGYLSLPVSTMLMQTQLASQALLDQRTLSSSLTQHTEVPWLVCCLNG